jgi:restriction system-associated AAA family ATPase
MKLIRLKLLSKFRGLHKGFEIIFSKKIDPEKFDPICFVGANGCGKSNVMEVLCEIFYYLDSIHLDYADKKLLGKKKFGFEIEYDLPGGFSSAFSQAFNSSFTKIKIIKKYKALPKYYISSNNQYEEIKNKKDIKNILPVRIIGYSSGMNELISNPFLKIKLHYFKEYQNKLKNKIYDRIEESRLTYMDYESNASILISNYLLQEKGQLKILKEHLKIDDLISFRISFRFKTYNNKEVELIPILNEQIELLKDCATSFHEAGELQNKQIILDYFVNNETKKAFKQNFKISFELYKSLELLDILNLHLTPESQRKNIRLAEKGVNISEQIPKPSPQKLVFRIEDIRLKRTQSKEPIYYKHISDGEHQFMHVVGTAMMIDSKGVLILLDEPETHFNPKWRSKLVSTLNKIVKDRNQEFILTTHSPFIISDCQRHNIFVFERNRNDKVKYRKLDIQTYGASSSELLSEVFEKEETISEMALDGLNDLRAKPIKTLDDIQDIKRSASEFGDSAEKLLLFNYLNKRKKEIEQR